MKLCAITVTFNRLEKLKKTLEAYSNSISKPDTLIVVDNASNDGTYLFLQEWKSKEEAFEKIVINLKENTGGAGGFSCGMEKAIEVGCDWILIGDDDAYIYPDTIQQFNDLDLINNPDIGAIACKEINSSDKDYKKESFFIDLFSFVGVFIKTEYVKKIGLPRKDFFIWYDDTEYSSRLSKIKSVVCIPSMKFFHDCKQEEIMFCWKSYYGYRNKIETLYTNFGKRYSNTFIFLLRISIILDAMRGKKQKSKVKSIAIKDFKKKKMGKNQNYLPGVFITK